MPSRFAIYYTPEPGSDWWNAGSYWLGRCALDDAIKVQPLVTGMSPARMHELTTAPRRYGWHATVKAPFSLRKNVTEAELVNAVSSFALQHARIEKVETAISQSGGFLALHARTHEDLIGTLAASCVQQLAVFRTPPTDAELFKRRSAELTPRQDDLLVKWGYPYVLDQFKFHLTLTDSLRNANPMERDQLLRAAQLHFAHLPPLCINGLSIFVESHSGSNFLFHSHHRLASP